MSAEAVISSLRKMNNTMIFGCDIYPEKWLATSAGVDKFFQVPKANDNDYISTMHELCHANKINFILPLTDPEVDVFAECLDVFNSIETRVCISSKKTIEICRSKKKIHDFFKNSNRINIIPSYRYDEISESFFKEGIIAKPDKGRSSEGIQMLHSYDQLLSAPLNREEYIFQNLIEGHIYTVDYVRDNYGNDFSIARRELLRTTNGAGISVEIVNNGYLTRAVKEIGKQLNILGCINLEFIYSSGSFYLLDVNPRFSAGIAFSQLSGYDMVRNHLLAFSSLKIDKPINVNRKTIVKKYMEIITDQNE